MFRVRVHLQVSKQKPRIRIYDNLPPLTSQDKPNSTPTWNGPATLSTCTPELS